MPASFTRLKRMGSGFFGEVWLAREDGLQIDCALKVIRTEKIINKDNYFQEAQVLKAAEHPNIVRVLDTGYFTDDTVYVSMELVNGGSLDDYASGASIPLSEARLYMIDVLRGLGHAHDQGIIHRDIKPGNILLDNASGAKLSDFGLALPASALNDPAVPIKGYQYWMHLAPEIRHPTDHTVFSDIYAAGVTLYRLVNGDAALGQPNPSTIKKLASRGDFPSRENYRPFVPLAFRRVINKAMSPKKEERYQSAASFKAALENLTICMDWNEVPGTGGLSWSGTSNSRHATVEIISNSLGRRDVVIRTASQGKRLRQMTSHGKTSVTLDQARRAAHRIMQDFVLGKI
jgi:serine/threonine protein kinase